MRTPSLPALFLAHGAPTMALQPGPAGAALVRAAANLPKPRAIVVVSAHWQTPRPTIGTAPELETIHDFHGFPPQLYHLRYPAQSHPGVAEQVRKLLGEDGLDVEVDENRGLDHGAGTPKSSQDIRCLNRRTAEQGLSNIEVGVTYRFQRSVFLVRYSVFETPKKCHLFTLFWLKIKKVLYATAKILYLRSFFKGKARERQDAPPDLQNVKLR